MAAMRQKQHLAANEKYALALVLRELGFAWRLPNVLPEEPPRELHPR